MDQNFFELSISASVLINNLNQITFNYKMRLSPCDIENDSLHLINYIFIILFLKLILAALNLEVREIPLMKNMHMLKLFRSQNPSVFQ